MDSTLYCLGDSAHSGLFKMSTDSGLSMKSSRPHFIVIRFLARTTATAGVWYVALVLSMALLLNLFLSSNSEDVDIEAVVCSSLIVLAISYLC